jgi:hypothetical protein
MKNIKVKHKRKIDRSIINIQSWKSSTNFMRYTEREQEKEERYISCRDSRNGD